MSTKFRPKRSTPASEKNDNWIGVLTRVRPPIHARILAIAKRRGASIELVARELIESCLAGWEQELADGDKPGNGASVPVGPTVSTGTPHR